MRDLKQFDENLQKAKNRFTELHILVVHLKVGSVTEEEVPREIEDIEWEARIFVEWYEVRTAQHRDQINLVKDEIEYFGRSWDWKGRVSSRKLTRMSARRMKRILCGVREDRYLNLTR